MVIISGEAFGGTTPDSTSTMMDVDTIDPVACGMIFHYPIVIRLLVVICMTDWVGTRMAI